MKKIIFILSNPRIMRLCGCLIAMVGAMWDNLVHAGAPYIPAYYWSYYAASPYRCYTTDRGSVPCLIPENQFSVLVDIYKSGIAAGIGQYQTGWYFCDNNRNWDGVTNGTMGVFYGPIANSYWGTIGACVKGVGAIIDFEHAAYASKVLANTNRGSGMERLLTMCDYSGLRANGRAYSMLPYPMLRGAMNKASALSCDAEDFGCAASNIGTANLEKKEIPTSQWSVEARLRTICCPSNTDAVYDNYNILCVETGNSDTYGSFNYTNGCPTNYLVNCSTGSANGFSNVWFSGCVAPSFIFTNGTDY